jgi:hypothetical protein
LRNAASLFFGLLAIFTLVGCELSGLGKPPGLTVYEIIDTRRYPPKPLASDLLDVWLENDEGWAVAPAGEDELESTVLSSDGTDWSIIAGPGGDLLAVMGDGDGGCVAVGRQGLWVLYDGTEWTRVSTTTYEDLTAVDGEPDDYWIVGRNGVLIHSVLGEHTVEIVGDYNFTDVAASPSEVACVATDGSVVLKDVLDGGITVHDTGVGCSLNGVAGTGGDGYLVVGDGGVILFGDEEDWTALDSPTGENLKRVDATSAESFMAVGSNGTVVLGQGGELRVLDSPTLENLTGVVLLSLNEGWIVGRGGTVLHYN